MDLNQILKKLVSETLTPILKPLGFKKSGNNYYREVGDIIQCLNLQQSKWNSAESKEFTLNLGLIHKKIFKEISTRDLPKFPKEYESQIRRRVSSLKFGKDIWYELTTQTNYFNLLNELNNDLVDYAIPFFIKYENFENWLDFTSIENATIIGDITRFFILKELGKLEEAKKLLKEFYEDALLPVTNKSTTIFPDGTSVTKESEPYINWHRVNYYKEIAEKYSINL